MVLRLIRDDDTRGRIRLIDDPHDLRAAALLSQRQRIETARCRTGEVRAVERILRAVAWTHEPVLSVAPAIVTAKMRADRAEDDEAHVHDVVGNVGFAGRK